MELLQTRYAKLHNALFGKLMVLDPSGVFDVWMKQESDLVQATSESFGEYFVYQQTLSTLERMQSPRAKQAVTNLALLYALDCVRSNLAWYLCEELIQTRTAERLHEQIDQLCRSLVPDIPVLLNAFEIPADLMQTPIAKDWIKFNERKNEGEVLGMNV